MRFREATSGKSAAATSRSHLARPWRRSASWGVDIGDFDGQITLHLVNGGTTDLVVNNTLNGPGGSVLFYGLIAQNVGELITSITFGNTAPGADFFAFDDMTIGSIEQVRPVPEPDSLLLVGLALTIAAGVARLRRRKS